PPLVVILCPRRAGWFAWVPSIAAFNPCRFDPFEIGSRRREPPHIDPAEITGRKREKDSASVALRVRSCVDRSRLIFDATEPRPHGCANPTPLKRCREARRASGAAGAKHSRTISHQRD